MSVTHDVNVVELAKYWLSRQFEIDSDSFNPADYANSSKLMLRCLTKRQRPPVFVHHFVGAHFHSQFQAEINTVEKCTQFTCEMKLSYAAILSIFIETRSIAVAFDLENTRAGSSWGQYRHRRSNIHVHLSSNDAKTSHMRFTNCFSIRAHKVHN